MNKHYQSLEKYVDKIDTYLTVVDKRLLTKAERKIILQHLKVVADREVQCDPLIGGVFNLRAVLCAEAAGKACEIHPDMKEVSREKIEEAKLDYSKKVQQLLKEE